MILFVDFKKAFDSVHRGKMMKILKTYQIPENLREAIAKLYGNTKARIISPDGETKYFEIKAGVLQGDALAPYLFAIVLDYVMRRTYSDREEELGFKLGRRRSSRHPATVITDFADDIALITEEFEQAQHLLERLENEAEQIGLYCNSKKTEAQPFNQTNIGVIKA